jgi:hypothetical protein
MNAFLSFILASSDPHSPRSRAFDVKKTKVLKFLDGVKTVESMHTETMVL